MGFTLAEQYTAIKGLVESLADEVETSQDVTEITFSKMKHEV